MTIESINQLNEKLIKYRKQAEDLLIVLQERSLIEEFYSKDLERLTTKLPPSDFPQVTSFVKSLILFVSSQALSFSQNLTKEVIENFKELLNSQAFQIKELHLDGLKNEKRKSRLTKKLEESKKRYWECCEECEQVAIALDSEPSVSKKKKLVTRLLLSKTQLDGIYKNYLESVDRYNKYKKTYIAKSKKVISVYSHHEVQLVETYSKIQNDLLSFQCLSGASHSVSLSSFPNIEHIELPVDDTSKLLEYPECNFEAYEGTHPLFMNLGINSAPHLHASIIEASGVDSGTQTAVENMYRSEMENIINKAWAEEDLTSEEYLHFNGLIKEHLGRKAWAWCLNLKRTQGNFEITTQGFVAVGELMVAILNECERSQDVAVAKNCIILSQTFYRKVQGVRDYLQNFIMSHTLWENMEFWEKLITSAIVEELKNQGEAENLNEHLKSLVFCQIVSFGHIMMSFKVPEDVIQGILEKTGNKYNLNSVEANEIMVIHIQTAVLESGRD